MSRVETRAQVLADTVEKHGKSLLSMIRRRIRDEVEAEDITQEVFEEFIEAYDVEQAFDSLGAWLFRVAQNKIVDRFRRRKTESQYRESSAVENPQEVTSRNRPDEDWSNAWIRAEITDALTQLPTEQREVFVLHELEGKDFEQIAVLTGRNMNTLLSQKRYALIFLRNHLMEVYDELE